MPDVGVLNLQIHDDSKNAAKGLDYLAGALARVKKATEGLRLNSVASSIKRIADAVNQNLTGNTITKIRALATELEKLKGLGNLNIKISGGSSVQSMKDAVEAARESIGDINAGFDKFGERAYEASGSVDAFNRSVQETEQLMQSKAWSFGYDTFKQLFDEFSRMRSAMALPGGGNDLTTEVSHAYGALRDGAIEVEGTVTDSIDNITEHLGEPIKHLTETASRTSTINDYLEKTNDLAEEFARKTSAFSSGENAIIPYSGGISELEKAMDQARKGEESFQRMREDAERIRAEQEKRFYAPKEPLGMAQTNEMADNLTKLDLLKAQLRDAEVEYNKFVNKFGADSTKTIKAGLRVQDLRDKIWEYKDALRQASEEEANPQVEELSNGAENATRNIEALKERLRELFSESKKGGLSGLISQFARIAKYRFLRAVLKNITEGFREGVENVYYYSKAIGGSFAPAMDSAASSLEQMKNSVGAAIAPAIQALIPLMQTLVGWFIEGVNYLNQFFALLNGQTTWTRAMPRTAKAFKDQEKAARSAGAAIKDLLASWDELNIIQSESGGGSGISGTTAAEDYLKMFEEVGTFENKIKDIVDFIKNNFETIKTVAIGIGAAMLAWKVAEGIHDVLKLVGTLQGGVIMSVVGFTLSAAAGASMGRDGFTAENVLAGVGGLAASALGGYWVGKNLLTSFGFSGATGGMVGAVAGLAIGAAFLITSFNASVVEGAYGTLKEDADTIRKNVMSYFSPKVNAEVNVAKAYVQNTEDAENKVGEALTVLEKDYPVAVTLKTKEALDSLQMSVSNLIREAEALILLRKQNIKIPIVASGQYGDNAESVLKFSTDQLDKTYAYMEDLGKKIGAEISNGITDGAKLDKLKQQLTDITNAVTFGLKKGEFAATMSIAGSKLRSNQYSKDALTQYINTYNTERDSLTAEAEAMARAEQGDLESIYASTLEMFKNNEATWDEVQTALDNYKKFDAAKEAQRILKEWVGEGDTLFGADIAQALSIVMERTSKQGLFFGRNSALSFAKNSQVDMGGVLAAVTNAEGYIAILRDQLLSSIAEETGQDKDSLKKLFDLSGINPLDLFDADYGNQIREAITRTLENSQYTEEEKNKIKEAFGFPDMKGNKVSEETNEAAAAYEDMASRIRGAFKSIDGLEFNLDLNGTSGKVNVTLPVVATMDTGGFPRSGDLIMANENGNIEMMGKMGSQPVVANNQQIVEGISHGVSNANEDVVSELRGLGSMMRQLLANGLVAKAVPGSDWGAHNARSNEAYERVRG